MKTRVLENLGQDEETLRPAALGFRAHSGWATAVVVGASRRAPVAIDRRRIDLSDPKVPESKQPYHSAEYLDWTAAEAFVNRSIEDTHVRAREALEMQIRRIREKGYGVVGAGIVLGSGRPTPTIEMAFASHAAAHAAEGELFRSSIQRACEDLKVRVVGVRERDLFARGASTWGISVDAVRRRISDIGKPLGSPWRRDEKQAALVGCLALAQP